MAGVGREQGFDDRGFSGMINFGDEIVGLFDRNADCLDVKCGAVDEGAGGARSLDGHIEHGV